MTDEMDDMDELGSELEAALSDNDELYHRIGELEDEVADLRQEIADLRARLSEHDPVSEDSPSYSGTD